MKARILSILMALVLGLSLVTAAPALANGINEVWVDDDYCSSCGNDGHTWGVDAFDNIQAGIDAITLTPGTVHVAAGTYNENITLVNGVSVYGAGAGSSIIDGDDNDSVVQANNITTATTFDGFTVTDGTEFRGGGMYNTNCSALTVSNCTFSDNVAYFDGGGMYNGSCSSVTITNCTFSNNTAPSDYDTTYGGGISSYTSTLSVTDCTFNTNTADYGGGMYSHIGVSATVTGCTFSGNSADDAGGGMYNYYCNPTVTNCTFNSNLSVTFGGGMYNGHSSPTVTGCTFYNNQSSSIGGGMANNIASHPTVVDCIFEINWAFGSGGGMSNRGSQPSEACNPVVANCIFTGNRADIGYGGGMENVYSSPTVVNCTFYGNTVGATDPKGRGMYNNISSPTVTNCILWDHSVDEIYDENGSAPVITYSNVRGGYAGTGNINADPVFADAGAGDFHLRSGSPCIDTGSDAAAIAAGLTTDFEGDSRFIDGNGDTFATVDMGADEHVPPPTEVWVDNDWTSQTDVDAYDPSLIWQWDAFNSIQDGIDAVVGSTVHVLEGTYAESIDLKDGVEVLGAGADVTIIDGGGTNRVVSADGVGATTKLDGFTIQNGSAPNGAGMRNINGSQAVISNCIFYNNDATGSGGGMYNSESSPTVVNCIFLDNYGPQGGGMHNSVSSPTVTNCTFSKNMAISDSSGGMCNASASNPTITNCVFWGDIGGEIGNIVASNPVVNYCNIQDNEWDIYPGTGNICADPLFVNAAANNFHLQPGSPCIDAGDNTAVPVWLTTGLDGWPRIADGDDIPGAVVDMGAYEYPPPPTEVWVDDDYCDGCGNDGHTWGYDAFDSIQDGIDGVAGSTVHVLAGTYNENITLRSGVDVLGAGAGSTTISGTGNGKVVTADGVTSATFDGFTVTNGGTVTESIGGGMYINSSTMTVSNCTIDGNIASYGGGIYSVSSSLTLTGCTFSNNTARSYGGGLANWDSSATITDCDFTGNSVQNYYDNTYGGGICNYHCSSPVTVTNCTFTGNDASSYPDWGTYGYGGGMWNELYAPTVTGCTFSGNSADYGGGMHNDSSSPTVTDCTFSTNTAGEGGGMYNEYSDPDLTDCTFSGNTAEDYGGGMYNDESAPDLTGCDFTSNEAYIGGGMCNQFGSSPTLSDCTFNNNTADAGGGMCNAESSSPTLTDCTFSGNTADDGGGGICNQFGSSPTVSNCTFYGNLSENDGGGMDNFIACNPVVTNCTFSGNTAYDDGGGMCNYESSPTLNNCILWGDTGGEIYDGYLSSAVVSYCDVQGGYIGTDNLYTDPKFVNPGAGDYHLQAGSPCIDNGDNAAATAAGLTTDFEGDSRFIDGNGDTTATVDMGADEYLATEVWVDENWMDAEPGDEVEPGKFFGYNAFAFIQDGINAVTGSTVHVAAGYYLESINLVDGVEVLGAGADETTIDSDNGRVVTADGVGATTVLDGFTITGGDVTGNGGGMRNINGSLAVVSNCIFLNNDASTYGGGMYNNDSSPTVVNCVFSGNYAGQGGGMYNDNSSPTVTNCTFEGNTSVQLGVGMFNNNNSNPIVTNCIFWDVPFGDIVNDGGSTPVVSYCDVQGGYAGTGNIDANPLFVDVLEDDYRLQETSPCIDVGNNSALSLPSTDFDGQPRLYDGDGDTTATVDMGADEYMPAPTEVWVDDDYCASCGNDGHVWGYDAFDEIREGIDAVTGSTVNVAAGTYYENIRLGDGVEVLGAGAGSSIIDGGGNGAVVTADGVGATTVLDGFTITNGDNEEGGGMSNYGSSPTVSNCTFDGNDALVGGGMFNDNSSSPAVTDCTFSGNSAEDYGGGMYNDDSSPTVSNCTFSGNEAWRGGGMFNNDNSSPTVSGCTFSANLADYGGGMANINSSSPTVTGCTFSANWAEDRGGGMYNDAESSPTVTVCTFSDNESEYGSGGGMYNTNYSSPKVGNCTFEDNDADIGGGMYNEDFSSPTVTSCTFSGNSAIDGGGMLNFDYSSPTVTSCTFSGNSADSGGGGMFNITHSSPTVDGCTFDSNSAYIGGGAHNENYSSPELTNCTFSDNTADNKGGGMYNDDSSPTVTNCTFSGNSAYYGDGMYNDNSSPTVTNCILWGNGEAIYDDNGAAPTVSYCDVQGGYSGTGNIDADPMFANPGADDYHLQPGSPCIDAGSNAAVPGGLTTDFEDEPRIMDGDGNSTATVDMGIDECLAQVWVDNDWVGTTPGDPVNGYIFGVNAFATIQDGIAAALPGGTVNVYPGNYIEKFLTIDKSLTVESVSGDWHDTIVDPAAGNVFQFFSFGGDATISGLTITAGDSGVYIEHMYSGSSITVSNCLIHNNGNGIFGGDGLDGDIFINECVISDNGSDLPGISLTNIASTIEITDSVIGAYYDSETATSYPGNDGDGILIGIIEETGSVLIDNCKIAENGKNGIADGLLLGCYGQLVITNNVIGAYDYDLATGAGYFTGNGNHGITVEYVAPTGVVIIEGNKITENDVDGIEFGVGLDVEGAVTINNNYIGAWTQSDGVNSHRYGGNGSKGINVSFMITSTGSMTIINNKIAENSYTVVNLTGLYIAETSGDVIIAANHVGAWTQDIPGGAPVTYEGNGGPGILVGNVAGGRLLIHGNTVAENTGTTTGIRIDAADETADINVNLNNIVDNIGDGVFYSYGGAGCLVTLDATNNWWGDTSGPGGEGPGTGDEVSTNVDYNPWLGVWVEGAKAGIITDGTLDNIDGADAEVIVTGSAIVTVTKYSDKPGGDFSGDFGKYIDVHIDDSSGVSEIEIRLYYTDAEIMGLDEATLSMRWWDGTSWVVCSDSGVNTTNIVGPPAYSGYVWAKIRGDTTPTLAQLTGSIFGGGGERPAPTGSDTTAPWITSVSYCYEGITETTADICWRTTEQSTSQVEYEAGTVMLSHLDMTYVNEHHVQLTGLTPCTTYSYRTMSRDRAGNLAISDVYTFTTLGETNFSSSDLSISPTDVSSGEMVTIGVTVNNTGSCLGSYTLTLKIDGVVEETSELTLGPGASESVGFTVSRDEAGTYSVDVDGLSGSFTVAAPDTYQPAAPAEEGEPSTNWPLIGGIIAAAVVIIGLTILFVFRRRAS